MPQYEIQFDRVQHFDQHIALGFEIIALEFVFFHRRHVHAPVVGDLFPELGGDVFIASGQAHDLIGRFLICIDAPFEALARGDHHGADFRHDGAADNFLLRWNEIFSENSFQFLDATAPH